MCYDGSQSCFVAFVCYVIFSLSIPIVDVANSCLRVAFTCSVTYNLSVLTVDVATDGCSAGKDCILSPLIVGFGLFCLMIFHALVT